MGPRKRTSSRISKGVPTTQKKQRFAPSQIALSGEYIEEDGHYSAQCKTEPAESEEFGVELNGDQSEPDRINGESSELANTSSQTEVEVPQISLEKYCNIKDEQEEGDSGQNISQELDGHSLSPSMKAHEDQKWILKDEEENKNVTTDTEDKKVKSYICFCGKSYTCTSHLNRHRKSHVSEDQPPIKPNIRRISEEKPPVRRFACQCGKQYTRRSNLKRHQTSCTEQAQAETTDCPVTYSNVVDQEEKLKPYVCFCGKSYTSSSHLYRHQRSHQEFTSNIQKRYICECGKAYSCNSHLLRHQKTHTGEKDLLGGHGLAEDPEILEKRLKPHLCFCGKRYTCSSHLYRHQKAHHAETIPLRESPKVEDNETEKRYKCVCGKSYTSSSHLYRHQRTHKNQVFRAESYDQNFTAESNDQDFTAESNDVDHDSEVDFDDCRQKPYRCECGKSFILSFSLLLHKKIHCRWKQTTN